MKLLDVAPWSWMYEFELFGVISPGWESPYFGSIMGMFRTADPQTNTWRTENRTLRTNYVAADIRFSAQLAAELKKIPGQDLILEADLSLLPTPIQDRDPEYFPFAFLLIDHHSGYIVHCSIFPPHPSVDEMFTGCGQRLLEVLTGQNIRPRQIHVCFPRFYPSLMFHPWNVRLILYLLI